MNRVEVLFSPAEFLALKNRDLKETSCVVFDILRATSTIVTGLANGARCIRAVGTIEEALAEKSKRSEVLLAGERNGFRITSKQTGSIDFDLGNSPREFKESVVRGKEIVITTTNGSRAIAACSHAQRVLVGSFLNLKAVAKVALESKDLLIVCSGTHEEASFEDALAAGALCDLLWKTLAGAATHIADSAQIAWMISQHAKDALGEVMAHAQNGRRLLSIPELRDDVAYCFQADIFNFVPVVNREGLITI
jgi:2-phosphosulfolactate phosphatase